MMTEAQNLIRIVGYVLGAHSDLVQIKIEDWEKLVSLACQNGIHQYVYRYMKQLPDAQKPSPEMISYMERINVLELRKGILQERTLDRLCSTLEEAELDHLFMKGSVTKKRYPDAYLRSMGDIDVLYDPRQHDALVKKMCEIGFAVKNIGRVHDIYIDANNILVEAHRQMVSSSSPYFAFCEKIWSRAKKVDGFQHAYAMKLEDEFLFNFMHLAAHFKKGGVGIRFIIDVWVYRQRDMNWEYVREKLEEYDLSRFYDMIEALSERWFARRETQDELVLEMEEFILSGGVFGNSESRKNAAIRNGRFKYFLKVCFPSFEEMRSMFPWLKNKAMLPVAWIRRIFESLTKRRSNVRRLMEPLKNGDTNSAEKAKQFLARCGLE